MNLSDLGYNDYLEEYRKKNNFESLSVGRVIAEHRERYIVLTKQGEVEAEITGNMRFSAQGRKDFPAVGDWVALMIYDSGYGIIHAILPRYSILERRAAGKEGEEQVIGTNIDYAFLVQAVDRDFNLNRIERYLSICYSGKVKPLIVISKTDLADETTLDQILTSIKNRVKDVPVIPISNEIQTGYENLRKLIEKGKTYCLLGSSGVGKSTLLNNLLGREQMRTGSISQSTSRGKHITSHRELAIIENGGIIIDNPGMREAGITDLAEGLETTFDIIESLSEGCRFKDCTHTGESGCQVIKAVERGEVDKALYENYLKIKREKEHFESSSAERRKKEKEFGKMIKNYKKDIKRER